MKTRYSIISDTGNTFWIMKEILIFGFSLSYSLIGEQSSVFGSGILDIPFYCIAAAKERLKEIIN